MKPTFNEKLIAYLTILSGLTVSGVAVYYSVTGLAAIFAGAFIPIIVMGVALEVSKIVASVWLKQNWTVAPQSIKMYLCAAIVVLMAITSMGIFGFLSKAHIDQNTPSADVAARIEMIDEKLKTERENIESSRKAIKQMDDAVDQVMARSSDEKGADKSSAIRRSQLKERATQAANINAAQKKVAALNLERAPIASELRKVEAEVGPIKYIASFFYGVTDQTVLEKSVTWMIILIIVVFDPLALIMLIASQVSFQQFRRRDQAAELDEKNHQAYLADQARVAAAQPVVESVATLTADTTEATVDIAAPLVDVIESSPLIMAMPGTMGSAEVIFSKDSEPVELVAEELVIEELVIEELIIEELVEEESTTNTSTSLIITMPAVSAVPTSTNYSPAWPMLEYIQLPITLVYPEPSPTIFVQPPTPITVREESTVIRTKIFPRAAPIMPEGYVQNEEQTTSNLWTNTTSSSISHEAYMHASQEKLEEQIVDILAQLKDGRMLLSDVPPVLLAEIKART